MPVVPANNNPRLLRRSIGRGDKGVCPLVPGCRAAYLMRTDNSRDREVLCIVGHLRYGM